MRSTLRALLICAFSIACLSADLVTMSAGTYNSFPSLTALNNPLTGVNGSLGFWDNRSVDGLNDPTNVNSGLRPYSQLNVGNFLTGTCGPTASTVGSCPAGTFDGVATPNMNPNQLGFYANGSSPISSFYFTRDGSAAALSPDLIYTANIVELGWYNQATPGTHNTIFANLSQSTSLPGSYSLTNIPLGTNYGFYAVVNYGTGYLATYYTESGLDTFSQPQNTASFSAVLGADAVSGTGKQHFALFVAGTTAVLGLEDGVGMNAYEAQGDYQDAVFSSATIALATPEPSTIWLAGLAIAGAFSSRRWFRRS